MENCAGPSRTCDALSHGYDMGKMNFQEEVVCIVPPDQNSGSTATTTTTATTRTAKETADQLAKKTSRLPRTGMFA